MVGGLLWVSTSQTTAYAFSSFIRCQTAVWITASQSTVTSCSETVCFESSLWLQTLALCLGALLTRVQVCFCTCHHLRSRAGTESEDEYTANSESLPHRVSSRYQVHMVQLISNSCMDPQTGTNSSCGFIWILNKISNHLENEDLFFWCVVWASSYKVHAYCVWLP